MLHCAVRPTLVGLCLIAGCTEPSSPSSDEPVVEPSARSGGGATTNIIVMNGLPPLTLAYNALLTNRATPRMLVSLPLAGSTFLDRDDQLGRAIHDPNAQAVFKKIVSCALPAESTIAWKDPFIPTNVYTFQGQLGLASGWATRGATLDEQEVVSACVLMLMNDAGYHVPVSPRGFSANGVRIDASAAAHVWPFNNDVLYPQFAACAPGADGYPHECGWDVAQSYIGTCVGNAQTGAPAGVVGIGGSWDGNQQIGSGSGARMLRVCDGTGPCTASSAGVADGDESQVAPYQCNAHDGGAGFFVAMTGATVTGASFTATPATTIADAILPAQVMSVYPVPEAGWFGNVFTGVLNPAVAPVSVDTAGDIVPKSHKPLSDKLGAIYPDMFYCHTPDWDSSDAAIHHRLCGVPDAPTDCVATHVGGCKDHCTAPGPDDQGAFTDCRTSPAAPPHHTLTDYLARACDITHAPGCTL